MRKRFFLVLCPLFITLISVSSFSGITIVRGGGGLGELNAINLFLKMETILNSCNTPQNICQLPIQRLQLLPVVLLGLQKAKPQLHFDPNLNTLFVWDSSFQILTINQQFLFDTNIGSSRSLKQILSLEIAALFARTTKEDLSQSLAFLNSWIPPFIESSQQLHLTGTPLKFHYLMLSFENGFNDVSLVIEGTKSSILLNDKISAFLGSNRWSIKDYSWQSGYLSFNIEWEVEAVSSMSSTVMVPAAPGHFMMPSEFSRKSGILVIQPKVLQGELDLVQTTFHLLNVRD